MELSINNQTDEDFIWDGLFKDVISLCLSSEGIADDCEVSVCIVSNEEIRALNKRFRNIDSVTDVLSFPLNDEEDGIKILGDIIISLERAREQALDYGHSIERELAFLAVHSTLHLVGYDHMTPAEEEEMILKQEAVLQRAGYVR